MALTGDTAVNLLTTYRSLFLSKAQREERIKAGKPLPYFKFRSSKLQQEASSRETKKNIDT